MSDEQRHTQAESTPLLTDEDEIAQREAENAIRQFDYVLDLIDEVVRGGRRPFRLRVTTILKLHEIALDGLSDRAGAFRRGSVTISGSRHAPPAQHLVSGLVDDLSDYVNENWTAKSALHLCAYVMWRLNWIHPFEDGNGRTSRALAYLVLCAKADTRLPGRRTVPEQITENKPPYYDALEAADTALVNGEVDLTALEALLESYLARQLADVLETAKTDEASNSESRKFH
jgi:Fic family protein